MEVFLEPVSQARSLVVIGAGHVGRAMVEMARGLPLRLTVIDDRSEFLAADSAFNMLCDWSCHALVYTQLFNCARFSAVC